MNGVGALLIDVALKASLLCLLAAVGSRLLRRGSAAARHDIGLAALSCCALLPLLSMLPRVTGPIGDWSPVHVAANAVATAMPADVTAEGVILIDRMWAGDGGSILPGWLAALLVVVWLIGIALAALRDFRSYREAEGIVGRASPFPMACPSQVRVLTTAEVTVPALFGWRAPAILLPIDASEWPSQRLRAVFAHEMAHVERRDWLTEWICELACVLHWYNPLVHRLAGRVRSEREIACDERVLAGGLDLRDYAEALVRVARSARDSDRGPLLAMAAPCDLELRVRKILSSARHPGLPGRTRLAMASALIGLFLPVAAVTAPAAGVLAAGTVQPGTGPLSGLDDPMSERVPLPYAQLARQAAAVPATGPAAGAIAALRAHLDHRSTGYGDLVRERAIWTLAQVQEGRLVEPLAAKVDDGDWRIRAYAAWGLASAGDPRVTPLLVGLLEDPVWRVRAMAADALAETADPRAAEAVMSSLDDPAWQVRISAVYYVDRIGDPALVRRLRPLLQDPHTGTRLSAQAVTARF